MAVKPGDVVSVDYEGTFDDGTVFDTSKHGDHNHPLEFKVGSGEVIAGFDTGIVGMEVGDTKTIVISPEQGYGVRNEQLVKTFPKSMLNSPKIKEGAEIIISTPNHQELRALVKEIKGDSITLDLNHPLAGKRLHFAITLLKILD